MSSQVQSTPYRKIDRSPQVFSKTRRQLNAFSPIGKRVSEGSANKTIITIKRTEEINQKNEKLREMETRNSRLEEKLTQYEQEKQALENTLKQRVDMYKRIIKEKQEKSQRTLESIQSQFRLQFRQLTQQKEQQERFFEQQSQIMTQKIQYLQTENFQLEQKVAKQLNLYSDLTSEIQVLKTQNAAIRQQYDSMLKQKNIQIEKLELNLRNLSEQWKQEKIGWKNDIQINLEKRSEQIKGIQSKLQNEIRSLEGLRQSENSFKDNEISQLKKMLETERLKFSYTLEAEKLRYDHMIETQNLKSQKSMDEQDKKVMEVLHTKQAAIDMLNRDISQLQNSLQSQKQQNTNLKAHISQLQTEAKQLQKDMLQYSQMFRKEKTHLVSIIEELKQQIRLNQLNYVRQKDRNQTIYEQNMRLQQTTSDREILFAEITQLRQLLMESSQQIEACRERFMAFQRQNNRLVVEMERLGAENNGLLRVRRDLEEEAIKWRQNYLRVAR